MAEYAGQGDAASTLQEEAAEVIQVIAKFNRFGRNWNEIPPGKDKTRWEMLEEEMNDLLLAWERLKAESKPKPKPVRVTVDGEYTTVIVHDNGVDTIVFKGLACLDITDEDIEILYEQYLRSTDKTASWDGE